MAGLKAKTSKASLKEKGIVYDDSRFRGATVTSEYPFGSSQVLGQLASSSSSPPLQPSAQQQTATFLPPSQNPFEDPAPYSDYTYNYPYDSAGSHPVESHYTHEDPFHTPPPSALPNANAGLRPMVPALTVTSPHNTQYMARVPSGSTIFSQPGVAGPVLYDGASTYSQQSFDGLAYDYRDSAPATDGDVLPAGGRGSYGQASIDSFYGAPASAGVKGPTITVKY